MSNNTRIIDLTLGELLAAVEEQTRRIIAEHQPPSDDDAPRYVYGIPGIMQLYHCSRATAHRIKKSGRIDHAITQVGGKMVVDVKLALHTLPSK